MSEPNELLELIRAHRAKPVETSAIWLAKRQLAAQLRRMSHLLCDSETSEDEILTLAQIVEQKADRLQAATQSGRDPEAESSMVPGMETFYDRGPIAGRSNPISPPASLEVDVDAQRVRGEVCFGKAFEGAPGCVHGGFVAAVLDEALGMACIFGGRPAMTAELTTRYLRHTPIEQRLEVEAWLDSVDGSKVRASGKVMRDGVTVVEASGLFIAVGTEKFAALSSAKVESRG